MDRLMAKSFYPAHPTRTVAAWGTIIVGTASLLHVAQRPADDVPMTHSGGLIGYGVGSLLERAVTPWVAVPLLILLLLFGLLVITATPISKVPQRLRPLADILLGRSPSRAPLPEHDDDQPEDTDDEQGPVNTRRPARRQGSL